MNLKGLFLSHINRVNSRPLSSNERSCLETAEYPGEYYLKRLTLSVLFWIIPTAVLKKMALELLWERRKNYWDFRRILKKVAPFVPYKQLMGDMRRWNLLDSHPWLVLDLMGDDVENLWKFAQKVSVVVRFQFIEKVYERSINTSMCDKYAMSDWDLIATDIDIAAMMLRAAVRPDQIQRVYDGVRLHSSWEKSPRSTQDKVRGILMECRTKAAEMGGLMLDGAKESPYQLINPFALAP